MKSALDCLKKAATSYRLPPWYLSFSINFSQSAIRLERSAFFPVFGIYGYNLLKTSRNFSWVLMISLMLPVINAFSVLWLILTNCLISSQCSDPIWLRVFDKIDRQWSSTCPRHYNVMKMLEFYSISSEETFYFVEGWIYFRECSISITWLKYTILKQNWIKHRLHFGLSIWHDTTDQNPKSNNSFHCKIWKLNKLN